jgi:hypothetical protein
MDAPDLRYRRQPLLRRRIDRDKPLVAARLYKGARPMVLARLERRQALAPEETIPITLSELRHQLDLDRGYWDDRRDTPSALVGSDREQPMNLDQEPQALRRRTVATAPFQNQVTALSPETRPRAVGPDEYAMQSTVTTPYTPLRGVGAAFIESRVSPRATAVEYRPRRMVTPSLLAPITAVRGLGAGLDDMDASTKQAAGIVILGLALGGGYFAGAAMAPAGRDKVTYGVLGSVLGLFGGPIGLGVLGLVALSRGK